jgi:UDP-2-acetamido-3-amino-2,3-dideoxy-glucuronate N-acetyltransferase
MTEPALIHHTAVVDQGAVLGHGTRVWHWVHVSEGARVGDRCTLGQNVFIGRRVVIGNGCKVQNNVSVYEGVTLEDDVFCGPSVVFTNVVNPRAAVSRRHDFRPTLVCRGATLGANATIVSGVTIGEYAFVGAGAVVTKDVAPHALAVGVPARHTGWMSRHGERLPLPLFGEGEAACPATGERYRLHGSCLSLIPD